MIETIDVVVADRLIEVRVTGKLTKEFYEQFVPTVERQIEQVGKVRILFVMHDFHGWTVGAMWEDMKFDWSHWKDIERLAIVGESKWQAGMAAFCKPFTKATIRYFDHTQLDAAKEWLAEE